MACALDDVTVVDLSSGAAAALATMFLCDQGARVIRLIPPGTSHLREGAFIVWDRGKTCVNLDLDAALEAYDATSLTGTPAADFLRLIAGADVLVEDFAPT